MRTLGILQGRLGEPALQKYVEGLNTQKKEKVTEAANSVKPSKYDKSQKKAAAEAAAKKRAEAAAAKKKAVAPPKKAEVITVGEDEEMKETPGENKGGIVLDDLDMGPPKKPVAKKPPNIG